MRNSKEGKTSAEDRTKLKFQLLIKYETGIKKSEMLIRLKKPNRRSHKKCYLKRNTKIHLTRNHLHGALMLPQ